MEKRNGKLVINKSGGTASHQSNSYRVTLPNKWIEKMKLGQENRQLELYFDGETITIRPKQTLSEYANNNSTNEMYLLSFYKDNMLCTKILANYTKKEVRIENEAVDTLYLAFGVNESPSWEDYLYFLSERCIPRSRSGIKEYLAAIGADEYEALDIIRKTKGVMAEDHQRLEVRRL